MNTQKRTAGEERFEQYLAAMEYPFEFEKQYPGKKKRPDYTITKNGTFLFDVKDFSYKQPKPGFFQYNPYVKIRERIEAGKKKFSEFKEFPCCVVLQNNFNMEVDIETPALVLGAMYGDFGYKIPVSAGPWVPRESLPPPQQTFLGGGRMQPKMNTSISALISLRAIAVGKRRRDKVWHDNPNFSFEEVIGAARERYPDYDLNEMQEGVIVWENVYARLPLSRDLFNGPFDERWGLDGNDIANVFCGAKRAEFI